ncbi:MAG: serpin family protein [candidate division WOR-3 bacterium]
MVLKIIKIMTPISLLLCVTLFAQNTILVSKLTDANNAFGFKLFSALISQDEIKNISISPASITIALAMTYNGADLATKDSMAQTLNITNLSLNEFNQANYTLRNLLTNKKRKALVKIANSLWADRTIKFKKEFIATNKKYYNAQLTELNFSDPKSAKIINNWVSKATDNKIQKIIEDIGEDVVAFIINAIYFKGIWHNKFDKNQTTEQPFYTIDGKEKKQPMMKQKGTYNYLETDKFQAVSLPYTNHEMSLYIFLPKETSEIKQFLSHLNFENWQKWLSEFRLHKGTIAIPKFKLEYEKSLKEALSTIGMAIAFDDNRANFSKMASTQVKGNIFIGDVKHKTYIEVNEEGTEAAAVTVVQIEVKAAPIDEFTMIVDHPFFYAIVDNQTNAVLFMGVVVEPE